MLIGRQAVKSSAGKLSFAHWGVGWGIIHSIGSDFFLELYLGNPPGQEGGRGGKKGGEGRPGFPDGCRLWRP